MSNDDNPKAIKSGTIIEITLIELNLIEVNP